MMPSLVLVLALVASAPAPAADSDPAECRVPAGAGSLSCDQQQKCIDARFKAVNKDPNKACEQNNKALWDKSLSAQLPKGDDASTVNAVCAGTYVRLQTALSDYKTLMHSACMQKDNAKSCVNADNLGEGNAAMACAAKVAQDNLALSQKARAALEKAREEAAEYKRLTQEVKKKYLHDIDAIQDAEGDLRDKGMTAAQIAAEKARAGNLTGDSFGTGVALGPADVNASNGGAGNLAEYEKKQTKLIQEQDSAAATIDAFNAASKREIEGRSAVEASLRTSAGSDLLAAKKQGPASTITGGSGGGGGGGGKKSDDDSSDTGSLLKNATSLTALAGAGASLANAMNRNNSTGSSSMPSSFGNNGNLAGSTSATPEPLAPASLGDAPSMGGPAGTPGAGGRAGQSAQMDRVSAVDGTSGGGHADFVAGSGAGFGGTAPGMAGGGTYVPGGAGSGAPDVSIKDDGRNPASVKDPNGCSGVDCAATNDLKTQQFSAGGSLGVPKIGAPDPALATKGALDSMLGPLPALDSLVPKDVLPGIQGVHSKLGQAMLGAPGPESGTHGSAAAEVAPANSKSLFDRVHSVHEVAIKRGSVALYHKRI